MIIFLDIDGVLNSHCFDLKRQNVGDALISNIDPQAIEYLSEIKNVEYVIISSWRNQLSLTALRSAFTSFNFNCIIDIITGATKEEGILKYLNDHNISKYIIIDDEYLFDLDSPLHSHLYKVNNGLTKEDIQNIQQYIDKV